jgi:hypothetical protein
VDGRRTAKSCGPDASTPVSSLAEISARRRWQESPITGEITKETVKTIARGMPGVSGVTVVTNSCAYYFSHARLRAHWAPGIPCALVIEAKVFAQPGRARVAEAWRLVFSLSPFLRGGRLSLQSSDFWLPWGFVSEDCVEDSE